MYYLNICQVATNAEDHCKTNPYQILLDIELAWWEIYENNALINY